jgi:hypothetical protein
MQLFNRLKWLVATLVLMSATSCIELVEHIKIYPDKSGDYSLTLDMGALSKTGMGNASLPEGLLNFPQFVEEGLKDVSGISDVKAVSDKSSGFYSVSFHFKNHKVFKRALLKLAGLKYGFIIPNYMKIGKHKFRKKDIGPMVTKAIEKSDNKMLDQEFMGVEVSSMINVTTTIETPQPVKRVKKNDRAKITSDPEIVEIKGTLSEIIKGMNTGVVVRY